MERVKNLILYHVATNRNYKIGDTIIFDENTITGQYKKAMDLTALHGSTRMCDYMYKICNSRFKRLSKAETLEVAKLLDQYDVAMRDLAIEQIRKTYYPDYPSRLHSMYLSETKDETLNNLYVMSKNTHKQTFQAIAVKLNGKIFRANSSSNISRLGQSYSYYLERAKEYWSQKSTGKVLEILFEGTAEVVDIIEEIYT